MEEKLTAKEITEQSMKKIFNTPAFGIKYFQPSGSFEEYFEIQSFLKTTEELISCNKIQKIGSLSQAVWDPVAQRATVTQQVGSCWSFMGHVENEKLQLFPEEALYLLETGTLELTYNDVPVSVQRGHSLLLEPLTDLTEDFYRVYSNLSANGYKVLRHNKRNVLTKYEKQLQIHKAGIKVQKRKHSDEYTKTTASADDFIIKKQKTEKNSDEFLENLDLQSSENYIDRLKIFKSFKSDASSNLKVHFDAYVLPGKDSSFKKACLQLPKVRVVVHRSCDPLPDLREIYCLISTFEDDVPIIHAVVFPEFVSYYNISHILTPTCL